ncbi:MAG: hypothetical protein ACFE9Z_16700, partial [Promethearchaeota archaeon]
MTDLNNINSPICFYYEVFTRQDLGESTTIVPLSKTPIEKINLISYKVQSVNFWQTLSLNNYQYSTSEVKLDLASIWSNLELVRIAYSFKSFVAEERTTIDPSFKQYSGTPDIQQVSASGTFYDDLALPFLWLNPTTKYYDPYADWHSLPNGMTYQQLPVISGLGNEVVYPNIKKGWDEVMSSEYTSMPELENSLIEYDYSYDSGQLSQYTNGQDDIYGDESFNGNFEGNYIDNVLISNPFISNNYNFSSMYYSDIHDAENEGIYNYYDPQGGANDAQYSMVRNRLINIEPYNSSGISLIYNSGNFPQSLTNYWLTGFTLRDDTWGDWGRLNSTYNDFTTTKDPINLDTFVQIDSGDVRVYMEPPDYTYFEYIWAEKFKFAGLTLDGTKDYYLTCVIETFEGVSGTLYADYNGKQFQSIKSGSYINITRVYLKNLANLEFIAGREGTDQFCTRVYYLKLEEINEDAPATQGAEIKENELALLDWSKYVSTLKEHPGDFGFEFGFQLPLIDRESLSSIQLAFSASIISTEVTNCPLSIQIWNYELNKWQSLPLFPLDSSSTYADEIYLEFWNKDNSRDKFRPDWITEGSDKINSIYYGDCFPNTINAQGKLVINSSIEDGASFLHNYPNDQTYKTYSGFYENSKILISNGDSSNRFSVQNIIIDPNNFYVTNSSYPAPDTTTTFSNASSNFYDEYINDLHQIKLRLLTEIDSAILDSYLNIGAFNTYCLLKTDGLNYNDFESTQIDGRHVSDNIEMTANGLKLLGYSGFNIKEPEKELKFRDNFNTILWELTGTESDSIDFYDNVTHSAVVRSLYPNDNYYNPTEFTSFMIDDPWEDYISAKEIINGTQIHWDLYATRYDDTEYHIVQSESIGTFESTLIDYWAMFGHAKTWDFNYIIYSDTYTDTIYIKDEGGNVIAASSGTQLSGSTRIEPTVFSTQPHIFVGSYDNSIHELKVDFLEGTLVAEDWESFFAISPINYLYYDDQDSRTLEVNRKDFVYVSTAETSVWAVGSFDDSITWNNRPSNYEFVSLKTVSYGTPLTFNLNLGDMQDEHYNFRISPSNTGGFDFSDPKVKYSIAKKHQEGGMLYMQTDQTETLSLKSDIYDSNVTVTENDQIVINCKGKTDNEIKLRLLSGGEVTQEFTIIPEYNTDFSSQIIKLETNNTIQFDQLEFIGTLDDKEYFLTNSIGVYAGASIIDTKVTDLDFNYHNINIGNPLSASNYAYNTDDQFFNISSSYQYNSNQLDIEFRFDVPYSDLVDVHRFDIKLVGEATSISLQEDAIFEFLNLKGAWEPITPSILDNTLTFSLFSDQFDKIDNKDIQSYTIFFRIKLEDNNSFIIHLDSINLISYKPWTADHDLYRVDFKFRKLSDVQSGAVTIAVNDDLSITINDNNLRDSYETNIISFNYDCNEQKWHAFLNGNSSDLLNVIDTDPEFKPRIESRYNNIYHGILIESIESHFYIKVQDQTDFEKYKSLIASYAYKRGNIESINTTSQDAILIPENLWAHICSDIDIIYSFHDEMDTNNIFDYSFSPTYTFDSVDNLDSFLFDETVFADANIVSKKYANYIVSHKEDGQATVSATGQVSDLWREDDDSYRLTRNYINNNDGTYGRKATDESFVYSHGSGSAQSQDGWSLYYDDQYHRYCTAYHNGGWFSFTLNMYDYYKFDACTDRGEVVDIDLYIYIKAWAPMHSGTPDFYLEVYNYDLASWETLWSRGDLSPGEPSSYWIYSDSASPGGSDIFDSNDMDDYIGTDGKVYVRTRTAISSYSNGWCWQAQGMIETAMYRCTTQIDPDTKKVYFDFYSLSTSDDYIVMFQGKTDSDGTAYLKDGATQITSFTNSWKNYFYLISNPTSTETIIVDLAEENGLDIDYLYLLKCGDVDIINDNSISLNSSFSKKQDNFLDSGFYDDPYLGKNNLRFTLQNSILTPMFGRENGSAYADLFLNDIDFDFEVYLNNTYQGFPLENIHIEGKDTNKYDPNELQDYSLYSSSRFRNSAIDDIQIPLITPIELDFGSLNPTDYFDLDLELALDWNINREFIKSDYEWNSRFRLVYYNYTSEQWEDFNGILRAENDGVEKSVWNPGLHDSFVWYLQNPTANNFIPIHNSNDINIKNPLLIKSINNNTIRDGIMKLAFISYILPANFTGDGNNNYFYYERATENIPIEISQTIEILECILTGESFQTIYPESSVSTNLLLNENYRANLTEVEKLGEIVGVKGLYTDYNGILYEYPIENYWIAENNELVFNSPLKYTFTSITLEYVPEFELIWFHNKWYLPNSSVFYGRNFTQPFLVSNLKDDNKTWGTYIHPDIDVGYTLEFDDYGVFVANETPFEGIPKGAIHFGKINNTYLYKYSLGDQLIYKYDILNENSDVINGNLHLDLNIGFKDVIFSELSQVSCNEYSLNVEFFRIFTENDEIKNKKIG